MAIPQSKDPSRNMAKKAKYDHRNEKMVEIFPLSGCSEHMVRGRCVELARYGRDCLFGVISVSM